MKTAFKLALVAVCATTVMAACTHKQPATTDSVQDTTEVVACCDTTVECTAVDSVVNEVVAEAPKKPAVKKAAPAEQPASAQVKTVEKTSAVEAAKSGKLVQGEGDATNVQNPTSSPASKPSAKDAFKRN
ncbi:MAG: hypothetical protein IJ789_02020 [Bacteroidales bacterium]|nr:hypothetical protein [Bacteroidales bacterium]